MRFLRLHLSGLVVLLFLTSVLFAQSEDSLQKKKEDRARQQDAFELFEAGKMVDALPLLERLAADHPDDPMIIGRFGIAMVNSSQALADPEQRRKSMLQGRSLLLKAQQLGNNSNLVKVLLEMIPENGGEVRFSDRKEVDQIMQEAEAQFARGNLDKAREGYLQALILDPNLYDAALFTGDTFFKQNKPGFAEEWFERAVQIDPDQETAYRYWGDTLKKQGRMEDARSKFIDAVVAEPYKQRSWMGLKQWAEENQLKITFLRLTNKAAVSTEGTNTTITLDVNSVEKKDASAAAWLVYGINQALWRKEKFQKEFPNENVYRHSMREEVEGLQMMVNVIEGQGKKKQKNLDPSLIELVKIQEAGLVEPFVLINVADAGIQQDYPVYRKANRLKIRQYIDQFVAPKLPPAGNP